MTFERILVALLCLVLFLTYFLCPEGGTEQAFKLSPVFFYFLLLLKGLCVALCPIKGRESKVGKLLEL